MKKFYVIASLPFRVCIELKKSLLRLLIFLIYLIIFACSIWSCGTNKITETQLMVKTIT